MTAPLRVLIVEDSEDDTLLLVRELRRGDYEVTFERVDTLHALEAALGQQTWDIILADYSMPQFSGLEALAALQRRGLDISLILVSGTIGEETAVAAMKSGASDYLMKDNLKRLVPAVQRELREAVERRERRWAERALKESEEKYRALAEEIPAITYISAVNPNYDSQFVSPQIEAMLGFSPAEWLSSDDLWLKQIHPDDRDRVLVEVANYIAQGGSYSLEYRMLTRDRRVVWISDRGVVVQNQEGRPIFLRGFIQDITERKHRERELEALVTVATALRAAPTRGDAIRVVLNQTLRLINVDGASLAMHIPATGEAVVVLARGVWETSVGLRIPPGQGVTGHVIATGQPYVNDDIRNDPRLSRPDLPGDIRAVACIPLVAEGKPVGAISVGRKTHIAEHETRLLTAIADMAATAIHRATLYEQTRRNAAELEQHVTERTHELAGANERLKELDRLKTKFVSDVSHELRTPVTNLGLYLDLLERGKPEKRDQYMTILKEQAARLRKLIEDILDLTRLERDKTGLEFEPVDLNALIELVVTSHQARAEAAGLTLSFDRDASVPPVRGVRHQLSRVVTNLVSNALNYTPAGQVGVRTRLDTNRKAVCVEVQDTGVGINAEDMPHLFERFYRGKHAAQSGIPGSGLGLGIVKEIVEMHGGTISVNSEEGAGTTFTACFPLQTPEPDAPQPNSE